MWYLHDMSISNDYHIWITLLLFICLPTELLAIKCYVCNSYIHAQCIGNNLDKFKEDCRSDAVGCRKIHYFILFNATDANMEERVQRQCAFTKFKYECRQVFGTNGKRFKSKNCECEKSLCNTGVMARVARCFILLTLAAFFYI